MEITKWADHALALISHANRILPTLFEANRLLNDSIKAETVSHFIQNKFFYNSIQISIDGVDRYDKFEYEDESVQLIKIPKILKEN
ncbi:hypothetical protein HK096_010805, partial [Nowakowskiella sp. JEL0078]